MAFPFTQVAVKTLQDNFFTRLDDDWALLCAGNTEKSNGMTVSWGSTGILWNKEIAICYVRPQRFTRTFLDESGRYTLCFFSEDYRPALQLCGVKSGRELDKYAASGLTPLQFPHGAMGVAEASLVLECRVLYRDQLRPEAFLDAAVLGKNYPQNDFHYLYIGEIEGCYRK